MILVITHQNLDCHLLVDHVKQLSMSYRNTGTLAQNNLFCHDLHLYAGSVYPSPCLGSSRTGFLNRSTNGCFAYDRYSPCGYCNLTDHCLEPSAEFDGPSGQGDDEESDDEADDVSYQERSHRKQI